MDVVIRRATLEDASQMAEVRRAAVAEVCCSHYSPEQIEVWAGREARPESFEKSIRGAVTFVAEVDEAVVGFAVRAADRLGALYVRPDSLRQGIGSRLRATLEAEAVSAGVERLYLHATLNSVSFYEACGFVSSGEETHALSSGVTLRCVGMEKSLLAIPTLTTTRLTLRPFQLSDAAAVALLAGAREIAATTLNVPHPYELSDAERWISGHAKAYRDGHGVSWAVVLQDTDELIGAVGLALAPPHSRAEVAYWIGVDYWRRGYCTEAATEVVRFAFQTLGVNRVFGTCVAGNTASERVLEKIGMCHEGTLRQHTRKWGEFRDVKYYGVNRDGWPPPSD